MSGHFDYILTGWASGPRARDICSPERRRSEGEQCLRAWDHWEHPKYLPWQLTAVDWPLIECPRMKKNSCRTISFLGNSTQCRKIPIWIAVPPKSKWIVSSSSMLNPQYPPEKVCDGIDEHGDVPFHSVGGTHEWLQIDFTRKVQVWQSSYEKVSSQSSMSDRTRIWSRNLGLLKITDF